MRFFSRKTRGDNKISIFRALLRRASSFTDFGRIILLLILPNVIFYKVFKTFRFDRKHKLSVLVCVLLCVLVASGSYIFAADFEQDIAPVYEYQTTNVFPGSVVAEGWSNANSALIQDENESALYGAFDNNSSAVLTPFVPTVVEDAIQESPADSVPNEVDVNDEIDTSSDEGVVEDNSSPISTEDELIDNQAPQESPSESLPEPEQVPEPEQDTESNEEPEVEVEAEDQAQPISSAVLKMVRSAYSFAVGVFSSSTDVSTEMTEDVVSEVLPVVTEDIVPEPDVEASEEPVIVDQTNTSSTTPESVDTSTTISSNHDSINQPVTCENCYKHVLEFADFSVGDGFDEQQITNMQLRISLGAQPRAHESLPTGKIRIEYEHYDYWIDGGTIDINDELSNAINGGYYLFGFPLYSEWDEMKRIKVRLTYESDNEHLDDIFVDSVWLEVESINGNAFNDVEPEPWGEKELRQTAPAGYQLEFIEEKKDFAEDETPSFAFKLQKEERKKSLLSRIGRGVLTFFGVEAPKEDPLQVRVINEEFKDVVEIGEDENGEYEFDIKKKRQFKPGTYVVTVEVIDGDTSFFIDQEFSWGVLALNTDKSIYYANEDVFLQMGVLDDEGYTLCDAQLDLRLTAPGGEVTNLSTTNSSINYGAECDGDTFTNSPDYDALYAIHDATGVYQMKLTAITENGEYTIDDSFEVREYVPFDVVRTGPTRIYPVEPYPVSLEVTAMRDYTGQIIEYVPQSFQVSDSSQSDAEFTTNEVEDVKQLIWDVSLKAGETVTLSYLFDAPDISPEFYLLGPLEIGEFAEIRKWQIASDLPGNAILVQSVLGTAVSDTTYSATLGSAPTAGNTIIMVAMHRDNPVAFNTPASYLTQAVLSNAAAEIDIGIWYADANAASTTYTITKTGGNQTGIVYLMEVQGLDPADELDVTASNDQTGSNGLIAFTGATGASAQYSFAVAAVGAGDNDFTAPTSGSWTSSSTAVYTQRTQTQWATGNDGLLAVATANVRTSAVQGARLQLTTGGTEQRNSVIAVFNLLPQVTTVGSTGNQNTPVKLGTNNNYIGGAFTLTTNTGSTTVTGITITESGTVNAQNDLSGIKLKYEMDTTAPYNCASVSYGGAETQYGATSTSFTSANGTATFNGSVVISTTSAMCVYTVVDVDSSATDGQTIELEIANPSTNVTVGHGAVSPGTAVSISNTTNIVIGYAPNTPNFAETPAFEFYKSTTTTPVLGGFAGTDVDGDLLRYAITIDDDYNFSSPATTSYSANYPSATGWASTTFASGATTTYRVPASVGLTVGQTYWYVVKAIDPYNKNQWSATSTPRSITISSSITVPEWYQTTNDQFVQGTTRSNATTTGSGALTIDSTDVSVSLLDAWSLGTTKTISAGTDRMLIIAIHVEDAGTDNVNTVTYGGQTVTQIYDQQIGTGFSDSLWVGYLNEAGIALAGSTTIVPTWTPGTPVAGDVIYHSAVFQNVDQTNPIRGYSPNALTSGGSISPASSLSVYEGDMALYTTTAGDNVTFTPSSGYTEGTDNNTCTDGCASSSAYKAITADGSEFPTATLSGSANRVIIISTILKAAPAEASVTSNDVDFNWVSNQNDWGEISWSVTEPAGSEVLMQVYYGSTCSTIVPNGALSGNASGFGSSSSPVDISGLSTSTYNQICLKATLDQGTAATTSSPTLTDWNITWERRPAFTQEAFRWYANINADTPTDPWPSGGTDLAQNAIMSSSYPTEFGDVVRLRMAVGVSSVSASNKTFKLQFAEDLTCSDTSVWNDVGAIGSTTALWRGYNNAGVSDGATLSSLVLTGSDVLETYEEENNSTAQPNTISTTQSGEWDWVLEHRASAGTPYCFRMVNTDGSPFDTYTQYPQLYTNQAPTITSQDSPFDNEKVATTTVHFDFIGVDPESDDVDYQIQIDTDADFSSAIIDTNSITNLTDFENLDTPADKSAFYDSESIRYTIPSALTNGVTYWWRVRVLDTNDSMEYSEWTTGRSFTIDTAVTVSTWFQTTEEQFDTDTLVSTDATGSDLVTMLGTSFGTTTSSLIDFDDADIGNAWGSLSWTDNETSGDIKHHVEFYDGSLWALVPNSALASNSTGFDNSPVSLIDLDSETYNQIRIRSNFTYSGGSPTLSDWTVAWGLRVSVPTHLSLFDNEKVATTSPTFTFTTTDPQGDDLEYQISYSTDNTFASGTTTRNSDVDPGFINVTDGGNFDPFTSGDTISYTVQSALTNGTTYWWRVRAKDPLVGDSYSFWSDPWSFTVDTNATTSTWFQTTQEQFATDDLLGLVASTSDSVRTTPATVTTYTFAGVTNPSATHVARYFEIDVNDPTDPPTVDEIDTITILGTSASTPNIRSGIAGYAGDVEASTAQYTQLSTSNNVRWTVTDPGAGDNAVFWARISINEDPDDIDQIDLLLEGFQGAATDKAWFGIWRPGSTTPYWQNLEHVQQITSDNVYNGSITSNIDQYLDGNNDIHLIFFNEDDDDTLSVDYVEVEVTSNTADSGVVTGTPIDFDDGNGPAWGQLYWTDSEPGLSSIEYQLQYLNSGSTWALIPDSALTGNSAGFTTDPIDLDALNTTTYNEIRVIGNFDCSLGSCPVLDDWTVEWSRGFTVSGTAKEYDGIASTTSGTVAVAVNGELQIGKTGTILANGTWTIENVTFFEDDIVTVFVSNADDDDEAVAITKYDGTPNIDGMRLQKGRVTIGSNDYQTITNTDLAQYDVTDDEDIFFDVNVGNDLDMCADTACVDAGIVVLGRNAYAPGTGADILTHDFRNDGTFTLGSNTMRVNGSWDNNATSTLTGSTVIFTATSTTESIDQTGATISSFNNLTFGENSGTATWNLASLLDVDGNLAVTYGTLGRSLQAVTIGGNLTTGANGYWTTIGTTTFDGVGVSTWTDSNATKQNIGRVVADGTTKTLRLGSDIVAQSMFIGSNDTFDLSSSNFDVTIYRDWINNNTFSAQQGTVFFAATTSGRIITVGEDNFYDVSFSGIGGGWSFTEATLGISNDFSITAAGTVTLPTGTTTIAGSFTNSGGTFVHNNAQLYFTSASAETLTLGGTAFTNAFYNARFTGAGSWTFTEANATTSNLFRITQGNVTLPSSMLTVGDTFTNSAGTFTHNSGTVKFINTGTKVIDTNSSFNSLLFTGSLSAFSFLDSSVTALGSLTISAGTLTLPSNTLTLGGSLSNNATIAHNSGTALFNSTDTGETIDLGNSSLYNMTFNGASGGWTISENATTTNNVTLTSLNSFTLASGKRLSVGATFTNSVGGSATEWSGSTLSLEAGSYSLNAKANTGDAYDILRVDVNTDIKMWNSSASTYTVDATGSLYSQDHNAVDGDLYIFGNYPRSSGTEYWSYATDFDGTALGGSSRQVDVRFASGASASFTNSTLNITGSSTATTTIDNQGSGNYVIGVSGGTTTASYYSFANLGTSGLSLTNANEVTSLAYGAFVPGIVGGTGLTVSSTTIDANPGLQVYYVNFSTTTAISATNVTQSDGTPSSYWWFRNSSGNLDGETYDADTGNPGSVRWDDSSLTITVAGTVYQEDTSTFLAGPTCGGGTPVRVVVEGGASYTGACNVGDGTFSIPGVAIVGDPTLTVYLDGAVGGEKAVTVTKTPTTDIPDLDLYVNHTITRHEDTAPMTIADMAVYDSTNDSDILFTAATGTPDTLFTSPDSGLFVWASSTFTPLGTVTLNSGGTGNTYDGSLYVDTAGTFVSDDSATTSIGGSFTLGTGGTFTHASGTVAMTATTSGKAITVATGVTAGFNQLRFTGVGGAWNLSGSLSASSNIEIATGTVTGTANISIPRGSLYGNGLLSLGSGTTTIQLTNTLGGTQAWTFANLVLGNGSTNGTTTPASNATTTISGKLTLQTGHYLDGNSSRFNFSGTGTVFVESGTFLQDTSTVRYSGTGATNLLSTTYYNLELMAGGGTPTYTSVGLGIVVSNNLTLGGPYTTTANFTTNDTPLDVNANFTIASNGTFIASNSSTLTIAGNYDNNGTFTSSGGTITFDGAGSPTISAGSSSFGNAVIAGAGSFTINEPATSTSAFSLTSAGGFTVSSGQTLAVGGVFTNAVGGGATTWTGSTLRLYSATNYQINAKTIADAYNIISIAPNTDIRMWNSSASTYTVDATGSLYSQDHNDVAGDLYVYGNYPGNGGNDYWSYAKDFDGTALGGGARQVDVRFQSGASMTLLSGGLQVIGTSSASTSLQNQGSGAYALRIGGSASTSWSYYDIEDTDSSGLVFSGTPNVVTLSYGDFEVSQGGGSAITVGGTVLTANPAKTFTNNVFATTTAISAFNVTATGTAVSSWRFTNHSGNIDGEGRDVDPDGNPGYIVWDDSAASITVSGNVYSDEGSSVSTVCDSGTSNIHLRVAGLTSYTTTCDGDGAGGGTGLYSISGVTYSPGDSLVVYIDGESEKGATVTEDPVSNINGMHIYENRVIVRHENTDALSIADMAVYDSTDDPDIPFTAVDAGTDTLTLPANRKLLVWTGKSFTPAGNVTLSGGGGGSAYDGTFEAQTNAVVTFAGTQEHSIGGSFIFGSGATFTAGLSTTTFTTSGSARTIDVNNQNFYNTSFTGSGSWTITDSTLYVNNLFITGGTLTLPTGTTTVTSSWSNNGGAFTINGSTVLFTATASGKIVRAGGSNFEELIFNGVGGSWSMTDTNATSTGSVTIRKGTVSLPSGIFAVGGDFRNTGGTITHNTSDIMLTNGTSATLLASTSSLYGVIFNGSGTFTFSDASITLLDDFTILQGSVTLPTSTLAVGGSWTTTAGTFTHATGSVLFNSTDTGETINPGNSNFYNVVFGSGTGGWTLTNATTTHNFSLSTATSFTQTSGTRLYVGNVFTNSVGGSATTWTGSTLAINSASEYAINTKTTGGDDYQTLSIGANTDLSMWNSHATTTTVALSSSLYSQDHATTNGALYIYGDYHIATTTAYWSYATDFDGTALGGSPRAVTVSIIGNATTSVDGGTLHIVGTSGNETTIQNQGSGVYDFNVSDGTFNALYYEFRNLNSAGLTFTNTPSITSLSYGDFELAVNGGSLITLATTTLDANASMLIVGNRFATTSAITGTNIELVGTTSNAWSFSAHTGNLDGEVYDSDGATDCGSIRWSDSACLLTQQTHYRWRNDDGLIGVPNTEWFNGSWDARQRVQIENADATTYTDAVVKIEVPYDSDMLADFDDLRFTDASGTTSIPHFIERYTASTNADVWVQVPTLTGSAVTTVFMYYDNAVAPSTSSSTDTFITADDFEDGSISEYSGNTSLFTVDGSFAYGGSYGLDATGHENDFTTDGIGRTDMTVSQGEIIRYMQYVDTSAGPTDEVCTLFGMQSPVTANQNYAVCIEQYGTDRISLVRDADNTESSGVLLSSTTVTYSTGWYEIEIDWQTDDDIIVSLLKDGVGVATTSDTDGTYTSGGMGFTFWGQNGGWDNYTSRPRVDTEPVIRFGAEQGDGGASWKADIDTEASYIPGDIARLRFAMENTGLQITGQTYDLEFAEKGASPSCQAVSNSSYAIVPNHASCGTSALCMATSTYITNGSPATDLLFGPEIAFVLGEVVEDPSNTTDSLTLEQNEYTEFEYAFTPTVNATESAYCLRATDAGNPVDTYLQVAELVMQFDPTVTNVSLNGGAPISLVPGATTTVYATGTATDLNGYTDLNLASSTMYRSGAGPACSANNNSCYISQGSPKCTFTDCSLNSCTVSCSADFYYHADATDVAPYAGEIWEAFIEVSDQDGGMDIGNATPAVELTSLHALDVTSGAIAYGSLSPASTTGSFNPTTTVRNLGNVPIDIDVEGSDLTDGASSIIPAYEQLFSTTTFTYTGCVTCNPLSSTTPYTLELDLTKPTSTSTAVTDIVYWGIEIPALGIAGNPHTGTNIFYAVGD